MTDDMAHAARTVYRVESDRPPSITIGDFATEEEAVEQKTHLVRLGWAEWDLRVEAVQGRVTLTRFIGATGPDRAPDR